jgi:hypothetical protein
MASLSEPLVPMLSRKERFLPESLRAGSPGRNSSNLIVLQEGMEKSE